MNVKVLDSNPTNDEWKKKVEETLWDYDQIVSPRGMQVREKINGHYTVPMPAFIDLVDREVNASFMFAEAAWILSGSNRLSDITPYMKGYAKFSDDGEFMRGAYGPKVVDQLPYVVEALENDIDSRQAVLTIWRERPGPSKDIPCTVAMQFFIRAHKTEEEPKLHAVVTMRSNDIILGFTYDVFTFSMVAKAVQLLLAERGIDVTLGNLHVNAGSLHLYDNYYDRAEKWLDSEKRDRSIGKAVIEVLDRATTYEELIESLKQGAKDGKKAV